MKWIGWIVFGLVGATFLSGFLHPAGVAAKPSAPPVCAIPAELEERQRTDVLTSAKREPPALLKRVDSPDYRRSAALSLKVADCVKAEDEIEAKLEKIRGEILDMTLEGVEGSRVCDLRVLVPSPDFRAFVGELRGMGKVRTEKITASRIRSGAAAAAEAVDPRELCLVSVRLADERVAADVLESRGVLASSFDRSAAHLMKGVAVIVEGLGFVLPFAFAAAALLVPAFVLRRVLRPR